MSRLLCCVRGEGEDRGKGNAIKEGDYLLPGGEWDPSISSSPSRISKNHGRTESELSRSSRTTNSSIRSFLSKRFGRHSGRSQASASSVENLAAGDYQPPPLVPSKTLPTFEEFKLLKTVGRGAFGKASALFCCASSCYELITRFWRPDLNLPRTSNHTLFCDCR